VRCGRQTCLASEILGDKRITFPGELFTEWKLVAVYVMVRIYTSVRVQLLQSETDSVRRITDFSDVVSDRVESVRVFWYCVRIS
jgi:hypothetical protein